MTGSLRIRRRAVGEGRVYRDIMEGCYLPRAAIFDHDLLQPRAHRTVDQFDTRRTVQRIDKLRESIDYRHVGTHRGYGNQLLCHPAALVNRREYVRVLADERR